MNLTLEDYERLNPRSEIEHDGVRMVFATPGTFTLWRVQSIYDKEPWTLEWIAEKGYEERFVFDFAYKHEGFTACGRCHSFRIRSSPSFKTDNSFHGVEPVLDADTRRRLLLYDTRCVSPSRPRSRP